MSRWIACPRHLYAEIAANARQVRRWKDLLSVDAIDVPPMVPGGDGKGETVSVEFLRRNPGLVVETACFDADFKARLLAALGKGIDERVTGVMVRGENLSALELMAVSLGEAEIRSLFPGDPPFDTPKPTSLVQRVMQVVPGRRVLDFFAGSGTTGHAVLNLNREDKGDRKFILVEVNDYFDTVLVPRILKATYSKGWKDGKPVDREPVPGGALYKLLYLESYDDTLANITLPEENPLFAHGRAQREYTVRYMLHEETKRAVLDLDRFRKPFGWTMEVRRGGLVDPVHPVDLVETFNYLLGLRVSRYGFFGAPDRIRYVEGVVIEGGNERKVLVLWRDCDHVSDEELVRLFSDREFAPVSSREYDRVYVNGDPPLANLRLDGEGGLWKVLAIEDEFKRLSFADDGGA